MSFCCTIHPSHFATLHRTSVIWHSGHLLDTPQIPVPILGLSANLKRWETLQYFCLFVIIHLFHNILVSSSSSSSSASPPSSIIIITITITITITIIIIIIIIYFGINFYFLYFFIFWLICYLCFILQFIQFVYSFHSFLFAFSSSLFFPIFIIFLAIIVITKVFTFLPCISLTSGKPPFHNEHFLFTFLNFHYAHQIIINRIHAFPCIDITNNKHFKSLTASSLTVPFLNQSDIL